MHIMEGNPLCFEDNLDNYPKVWLQEDRDKMEELKANGSSYSEADFIRPVVYCSNSSEKTAELTPMCQLCARFKINKGE